MSANNAKLNIAFTKCFRSQEVIPLCWRRCVESKREVFDLRRLSFLSFPRATDAVPGSFVASRVANDNRQMQRSRALRIASTAARSF